MFSTDTANSSELPITEGVSPHNAITGYTERDALPEANRDKNDALFKESLCYGVSLGLSIGLSYGLKYIVNRPRPYITHPDYINNLATEGSPSFPSTHTTIAFSVATSLTLMYPKWYVAVPSYIWAASVGYSRMNIGVHYPSDVLTGALLGAGSAYLTYELNKLLWKKTNNKPLIGLKAYQE